MEEAIVIPMEVFNMISKEDSAPYLLTLYVFYKNEALVQKTNCIKSTTEETAKNTKFAKKRIQKCKKILRNLRLIEDVKTRDENGWVTGWYIQVL
jgi:hypothetical protein